VSGKLGTHGERAPGGDAEDCPAWATPPSKRASEGQYVPTVTVVQARHTDIVTLATELRGKVAVTRVETLHTRRRRRGYIAKGVPGVEAVVVRGADGFRRPNEAGGRKIRAWRTSERANERTSERANERTSERANERTSEARVRVGACERTSVEFKSYMDGSYPARRSMAPHLRSPSLQCTVYERAKSVLLRVRGGWMV